jgi:hypothetical protein
MMGPCREKQQTPVSPRGGSDLRNRDRFASAGCRPPRARCWTQSRSDADPRTGQPRPPARRRLGKGQRARSPTWLPSRPTCHRLRAYRRGTAPSSAKAAGSFSLNPLTVVGGPLGRPSLGHRGCRRGGRDVPRPLEPGGAGAFRIDEGHPPFRLRRSRGRGSPGRRARPPRPHPDPVPEEDRVAFGERSGPAADIGTPSAIS